MKCPKCKNAHLKLINRDWDYDDGELLCGIERYNCPQCDNKFDREVIYYLEKEGDLENVQQDLPEV